MGSPYADLQQWTSVLQAIQSACVECNQDTLDYSLNAFANLTMSALLKSKNITSFAASVSKKVGHEITPYGWSLQDTFASMNETVTGEELIFPVRYFIAACCDPSCVDPSGWPVGSKTLDVAFPDTADGNSNWTRMNNGIHSSNLDAVIISPSGGKQPNALVLDKLNKLRAAKPPSALADLVKFLSTIAG